MSFRGNVQLSIMTVTMLVGSGSPVPSMIFIKWDLYTLPTD